MIFYISFSSTTQALVCLENIKKLYSAKIISLPVTLHKNCFSVGLEVVCPTEEQLKETLETINLDYKNIFNKEIFEKETEGKRND